MASQAALREEVVWLLRGGHAHVGFKKAFAKMPEGLQGKKPRGAPYSPWQQLEHLRICQWDILEYIRNPDHVSPPWPGGYWPAAAPPARGSWAKSVRGFEADLKTLEAMAAAPATDLLARVPADPDGPTLLHELLLVADHNAYHLGQLLVLRRLLGAWED
ncbi:MAG TPA: DinB family protein [bacterium]|nr:DinB family protein [bacterium]